MVIGWFSEEAGLKKFRTENYRDSWYDMMERESGAATARLVLNHNKELKMDELLAAVGRYCSSNRW